MSDPAPTPDPPKFDTFDPARQAAREDADRIMSDPPPSLMAWADKQGVSLSNRDSGVWGIVERRLARDGLLGAAQIWREEQIRELMKAKVTGYRRTAKEIVMRCLLEQMYKPRKAFSFKPYDKDGKELDCLPSDLKWIYCHPMLVPDADSKDPLVAAIVTNYERNQPAPHQGAINRLRDCQEDRALRRELFKEIKEIQLAHRKQQLTSMNDGGDEDGGGEKSKDEQEADELFDEIKFDDALLEDGGEA